MNGRKSQHLARNSLIIGGREESMNAQLISTIVGAGIALIGVLLTLIVNQRNLATNLRQEREKAREERTFQAKQNVLLSAVESVTRFLNYYVTLPDKQIPRDGAIPIEVSEMAVSLNRLHFYCGVDTIRQSMSMIQVLNTSFSNALKIKLSSEFIWEKIKNIDTNIAGHESVNTRLHQELVALLGSDPSNPFLIHLREQLADNFKTIAELHGVKTELVKAKYLATEACRDEILNDLKTAYDAILKVLLLARRELAFPIDVNEYTTILTEFTHSSLFHLGDVIEEIRTEVTKMMGS